MKCPKCGEQSRVMDSREITHIGIGRPVKLRDTAVRRRHDCACGNRFTTYECTTEESTEFRFSVLENQIAALRKQVISLAEIEANR